MYTAQLLYDSMWLQWMNWWQYIEEERIDQKHDDWINGEIDECIL